MKSQVRAAVWFVLAGGGGMELQAQVRLFGRVTNEINAPVAGAKVGGLISGGVSGKPASLLSAALLFFTPMAILMSSARNSRTLLDGLAFALGLVVGPAVAAQKIGLDLMWTGLIAGTMAYGVHRLREARRKRAL